MSKKLQYAHESMEKALIAVRKGMSQRQASKIYSIPRATLQDKLHGRVLEGRKMGPSTVLSNAEEQTIEHWILELSKIGFPRKKIDVLNTVNNIIDSDKRVNPFKNNRPGETWYRRFLERHPTIATRTAETVNKARAGLSEVNIRKWFSGLHEYLKNTNNLSILEDGSRIFNSDETNFQLCPKSGKVLGPRGWKNVYEIAQGKEKETLTVLGTFSASGEVVKGMIVFPYVRPPKDVIQSVPDSWAIGLSESGWMRSETFYEYVANVFHPWLTHNNINKRPVLFLVDGHKTHLTYQLSQFCSTNEIILYCLFPNATHILQPADVSVFRPLKVQWKKHVREWQIENVGKPLSRLCFAPILDRAMSAISKTVIINGFRACGIFPFNPDAIDFSKCISDRVVSNPPEASTMSKDDVTKYQTTLDVLTNLVDNGHSTNYEDILQTLKHICSPEEVTSCDQHNSSNSVNLEEKPTHRPEDELDTNLNNNLNISNSTSIVNFSNEMIIADLCFEENDNPINDMSTSNVEFISDVLGIQLTTTTISDHTDVEDFLAKVTAAETTPFKTSVEAPSQASTPLIVTKKTAISRAFSKHLFWPTVNTAPSEKKIKRKMPYAVSSEEWKKMFEEKEREIAEKELKKKKRKQPKSESTEEQKKKMTVNKSKRKLELTATKSTDEDAPCLYCSSLFSCSKPGEKWIQCGVCKGWVHEKCCDSFGNDEIFSFVSPLYIITRY